MKFEFDSISELQDFLEFAGYEKRTTPELDGESPVPDAHLMPEERVAALAAYPERSEWPNGDTPAQQSGEPRQQTEPEPPKRKRRTKAEIEADRARIQADVEAKMRAEGQQFVRTGDVQVETSTEFEAIAATSPLAGANPFDASTSNEPAATAALSEAPAGATGTLAALAPQGIGEPEGPVDAQTYMQLRVAEMGGTFDPREHMKKCVEFIGALGKAKYDEAFTLAGTSRAVASYTPADCAKHIAALEYLQITG